MIHVLVIFDRRSNSIVREVEYRDDRYEEAAQERLKAEIAHRLEPHMEIVVISGPSREVILSTHGRYWKTVAELAREAATVIDRRDR